MSSEKIQDQHGKDAVYKDHQLRTAHTLFDSVHFPRSAVLSNIGSDGRTKATNTVLKIFCSFPAAENPAM